MQNRQVWLRMNELDEVFERTRVWPVWLDIEGKAGLTLWASTENDDYMLATGQYVLLFPSTAGLGKFDPTKLEELEELSQDDMREASVRVVKMVLPHIITIE